jgi:hypothetical protein
MDAVDYYYIVYGVYGLFFLTLILRVSRSKGIFLFEEIKKKAKHRKKRGDKGLTHDMDYEEYFKYISKGE